MLYDNNESPRRRFIEVSEQELFKAVIEMCKKLGISNSGLGDYNLAALVIECQRETKEKLKKIANAVDS